MVMINTGLPGWQEAHDRAGELADALHAQGVSAIVHKPRGGRYHPCVEITVGWWRLLPMTDYIYVAADVAGEWWFWSSTLRPVAPVADISVVAGEVVRALAAIPTTGGGR